MDDPKLRLAAVLNNTARQLSELRVPNKFVMQAEKLVRQLDDNCVVAVVGRVKAGKSTFINALLGSDLAPVGVTETTATINRFRCGQPVQPELPVLCKRRGRPIAEPQSYSFLKSLQGNDIETLRRAEEIEYLEYLLPHPFLHQVTLVDTPGIGSVVDVHQNATAEYMRLYELLRKHHEEETRRLDSDADAVIYLMGDVPRFMDQTFLEGFAELTGGKSRATNAIGVLAKIDMYDDFPEGPPVRAAKYAAQLKDRLNTIVPVSAGLQRALDRLRVNNWTALTRIMETLRCIAPDQLALLLESPELFLEEWDFIESPVSVTEREELLGDLDWTVFKTIVMVAEAARWDLDTTVKRLTELAGFGPLTKILRQYFFERGRLIRSYRILRDALKILQEVRRNYLRALREQDAEDKARLTRFLAFLQQANGDAQVRTELKEFVISHSYIAERAEQVEKVLEQIERELNSFEHVLQPVQDDLRALQLLDDHANLFSDQQLEELWALFGRKGMENEYRLSAGQRDIEYIQKHAQAWHTISWNGKYRIEREIAELAEICYGRILDEMRNAD